MPTTMTRYESVISAPCLVSLASTHQRRYRCYRLLIHKQFAEDESGAVTGDARFAIRRMLVCRSSYATLRCLPRLRLARRQPVAMARAANIEANTAHCHATCWRITPRRFIVNTPAMPRCYALSVVYGVINTREETERIRRWRTRMLNVGYETPR